MRGNNSDNDEWCSEGLRFECTQCGNCCTGPPGYVWFHFDELKAMAAHLKLLPQEFLRKYARKLEGRWTLDEVERDGQFDCVFLEREPQTGHARCSIYPVRPTQCRTWPFWPDNLRSPRAWRAASRRCPGMAHGNEGRGNFVPIEKIRVLRDATPLP